MSELASSRSSLTFEECQTILHNVIQSMHPQIAQQQTVTLEGMEMLAAENVIGFLGEYHRLRLTYRIENSSSEFSDHTTHLFVKSPPQSDAEKEKKVILEKECGLYSLFFSNIRKYSSVKWCPLNFYARNDLFVMEDLSVMGYRHSNSHFSDLEMEQLLRSLAAMHASCIAHEIDTNTNIGEKYADLLTEITVSADVPWFTTGIRTLLELATLHPEYQSEDMQKLIRANFLQYLETVYVMMNPSVEYRNVLCHRDCWSGNVLFPSTATDGDSAIFVDFQTCRYCPPAIDLVMVFYMNLEREKRKDSELDYINLYFTNLKNFLSPYDVDLITEGITLDNLHRSYKEFELFGMVYNAIAATIIRVPPEYVTDEYKLVNRTKVILDYQQTNSEFRAYMEECIKDLIESMLQSVMAV